MRNHTFAQTLGASSSQIVNGQQSQQHHAVPMGVIATPQAAVAQPVQQQIAYAQPVQAQPVRAGGDVVYVRFLFSGGLL